MLVPALRRLVAGALLLVYASSPVAAATAAAPAQPPGSTDEWNGWGGNVYNNRWNTKNTEINSTSVAKLTQNCKLDYPVGVSATPVVLNYTVYYPTANGSFYAFNYVTCDIVWQLNVTQLIYDFAPPSALTLKYCLVISRTSPQIDGDVLYFGTQAGALLIAVDLNTGQHLSTVQVNSHPVAICTMSPTVYNGKIFIGASSHEDGVSNDPTYKCCTFIGNFVAFTFDKTAKKFTKSWEVDTMPPGQGWSGASVWGSQPSIDPVRGQVFIGTGQTLTYPAEFVHCINQTAACLPDDVYQDSVLAIDITSGKVNWKVSNTPIDGWVQACGYAGAPVSKSPLCPGAPGPDSDFGMAPTFVPASLVQDGTDTTVDTVVVGQKNGNIYNINAATGAMEWLVAIGADSSGSWLSWGLAIDTSNIYFTGINYGLKPWTLKPSGVKINNSAWGALDLKTGNAVWQTPVPDQELAYTPPGLVNDILLVGEAGSSTVNITGTVHALSKTDGSIVHSIPVDSVQDGGIIAHGGFVMFGTGYAYRNPFNSGSFYVYALPGAVDEAKAAIAAMPKPTTSAAPSNTANAKPSATSKKSVAAGRPRGGLALALIYPIALLVFFYH